MPEWLQGAFHNDLELSWSQVVISLAASLVLGCVVAGVYRLTHGSRRGQTTGLTATLVLLTVLICVVTIVIGGNVARAFSLVGALAIVRFRTVVEDTRDTAFVIFAVALGMAVGAGFYLVSLVSIPFAAGAAFLFRPRNGAAPPVPLDFQLRVRIGAGRSADALLRDPFAKHLAWSRQTGAATARQGAAFDLTYLVRVRQEDAVFALVAELNGVEGVQEVELRQP